MCCLLNLLLYIKVTIAAGVGQQGNWDNQSDISVRLRSRPAVGDTLTVGGSLQKEPSQLEAASTAKGS